MQVWTAELYLHDTPTAGSVTELDAEQVIYPSQRGVIVEEDLHDKDAWYRK